MVKVRRETNRTGRTEVLGERVSSLNGGQGASGAAVEGVRLDVDGRRAVVLDDGLLGRDAGGDEGSAHDGGGELHFGGLE